MGGGDLNLKKSWHPSTMKNMEKVWKAQQQDNQEKKKIAELKRDIELEREREDLKKYAMEQGTIEKKDNKKLDWMYTKPQNSINREEYLLGKKIDKNFEKIASAEKNSERNELPGNHVDYECVPPSIRSFSGNEQVDLARKLQEDPMFAIKKKEMESRSKLLQNPVKLKKLQELVKNKSSSSSSHSRSSKSDRDSDRSTKDKDHRKSHKKTKLSEKEKLKRLKAMMSNGSWREEERKKNVKRYREQDKLETSEKEYNPDFIRKQLAKATEEATVASRIKSNVNNIQRSNRNMDRNFARR
ncbi:GSCOCG00004886001-RA-CDS [Cotesia congregata]|uniref:Similar to Cwc25: Pre-mRNA-splicing factor CWC25 homolog (Mus musculus) n=1 Tax=Cotesia congregata TaxID=51543 RepID=A0A8J2MQQ0_COTCN|nr:GSCOCG00004886001-RA-CDS [Cotesia congregata]CAG5102094.1 Similar to Cwc25: Pre-mRNA-splicing factor CWC25 homolog (Mus musculus) [Cotesia congregata]